MTQCTDTRWQLGYLRRHSLGLTADVAFDGSLAASRRRHVQRSRLAKQMASRILLHLELTAAHRTLHLYHCSDDAGSLPLQIIEGSKLRPRSAHAQHRAASAPYALQVHPWHYSVGWSRRNRSRCGITLQRPRPFRPASRFRCSTSSLTRTTSSAASAWRSTFTPKYDNHCGTINPEGHHHQFRASTVYNDNMSTCTATSPPPPRHARPSRRIPLLGNPPSRHLLPHLRDHVLTTLPAHLAVPLTEHTLPLLITRRANIRDLSVHTYLLPQTNTHTPHSRPRKLGADQEADGRLPVVGLRARGARARGLGERCWETAIFQPTWSYQVGSLVRLPKRQGYCESAHERARSAMIMTYMMSQIPYLYIT
jgi:hypothetical protein